MDKKTLQDTAKKHVPAQHKGRNALIAFISGGALAVVAQLFMMLCMDMFDLDKDTAVSVTVVTVILVTALLCNSEGNAGDSRRKAGKGRGSVSVRLTGAGGGKRLYE